jgi:hypothetical protein
MSAADYILGLLTIVTGLAISDMIVSLHGLLINRRQVKWDWLPLVASAFVLVLIINTWRMTYVVFEGSERGPPIWIFLIILSANIGLYLAARAALPDRVDIGKSFSLRDYYEFVARYLWSALAVLYGGVTLMGALTLVTRGETDLEDLFVPGLMTFPVVVALAIWTERKLHRIAVPLLFVWLCVRVLPARLLTL